MTMKIARRRLLGVGAAGASLAWPGLAAWAEESWPTRPIRMVVPFTVGGGADMVGRIVADALAHALGQPVIVENRAGAGGIIGNDAVAKAAADGYTVLFTNASSTVMTTAAGQRTPYDLERDLMPISQVCAGGILLVARSDLPATDLRETIALIRRQPNRFSYGTWGAGSTGHLLMEALKHQENLDLVHVPYKGAAPILQDVLGGVLKLGWADPAAAAAQVRAGAIRPLAISGSFRAPALPQVATMVEQGYPMGGDGWVGLFGRTGMPDEIVERLSHEVNVALESLQLQKQLATLSLVGSKLRSPDEFARSVRADVKVWRELIQRNGIQLDV